MATGKSKALIVCQRTLRGWRVSIDMQVARQPITLHDSKHLVAVYMTCYLARMWLDLGSAGGDSAAAGHQTQLGAASVLPLLLNSLPFWNNYWVLSLKWTTGTFPKGQKYIFPLRKNHEGIQIIRTQE